MTYHIIHSEDGQNYDLTTNRIAFGLLPKDVQEAMKAWPHGWKIFSGFGLFEDWPDSAWYLTSTYRAVPAPKVKEYVLYWREGWCAYPDAGGADTHRIIIRDDGTGNMTATVEAL
jgi:hypothetical protein